jgi:GTPase involved in cell partitioning and DNA repair
VRLSDDRSFVVADVPGLIKGAHEGHGLGHQFLRHIERTKVLVHLVDVSGASGRDPVEDFETITDELKKFSPDVAAKPQIVVANKMDAVDDPDRVKALERHVKKRKLPCLKISAATGDGLDALLEAVWNAASTGVRLKADTTTDGGDASDAAPTAGVRADLKVGPGNRVPADGREAESTDLIAAARRSARARRKA